MHVFLVRHAKAGSRQRWDGPDHLRPLSPKGREQADALARILAERNIRHIASSPYVRCVQTVAPLGDKLGVRVREDAALAEGHGLDDVMGLVEGRKGRIVLCSHGDVIPVVLDELASRGHLTLPRDFPCPKGSVWEVTGTPKSGMHARYIPPPA